MYLAAKTLSEQVTETELAVGCLYPPLNKIRHVSTAIAVAIAEHAFAMGTATETKPEDLVQHIKSLMYDPFEDPFTAV